MTSLAWCMSTTPTKQTSFRQDHQLALLCTSFRLGRTPVTFLRVSCLCSLKTASPSPLPVPTVKDSGIRRRIILLLELVWHTNSHPSWSCGLDLASSTMVLRIGVSRRILVKTILSSSIFRSAHPTMLLPLHSQGAPP